MFKYKKIIMAFLIAVILPIAFKLIIGKPESQVDMLISAIPCELLLTIVIGYLCYSLGFKYTGIRKPQFNKLYYLIPEIILIIIIVTTMVKVPSVDYSITIILKLLVMAVLVGIYEELLSRGLVLHLFTKSKSPIIAIICSGLFFAFLHISNYHGGNGIETYLQVVETFAAGAYASVMTLALRSIIPLMITHFLYDFFLFTNMYFSSLESIEDSIKPIPSIQSIFSFSAYIMPLLYLIVAIVVYLIEKENVNEYVTEVSDKIESQTSNYGKYTPLKIVLVALVAMVIISLLKNMGLFI